MDDINGNLLTVFLPLAAIAIVFGFPIGAFVFFRVLAHRERMAMIAAGFAPGTMPRAPGNPKFDKAYASEPAQVTLNKGIRLAALGLAITIGVALASFHGSDDGLRWHPGPWLLLGLVPLFIGIAQVIIGVLAGSNVAAAAPSAAPGAPPLEPDPFVPPPDAATLYRPDPFDGPYPGRPTNLPEFHPPATPEP